MPIQKPSILKPTDYGRISGVKSMPQAEKAKHYEALRPGVNIPEGQKAERFERMQFRNENGVINRRRRATAGHISIPSLPWMKD